MEAGRDIHTHGEYIPGAFDTSCIDGVGGFGTAIDSLAAIKHLIYDTKKLTWDQLMEALEANWEGHEAVRQMCLNAPKNGNGIEWVDAIGFEIQRTVMKYCHEHPKPRVIPITFHVPSGMVTFATPSGRPAGEFLSEGISPSHGMDTKGPTVTLGSIARATCQTYNTHREDLMNMKMAPGNVAGEAGTRRLMQLIRVWCAEKHSHIQFNILNQDTLLDAQKHPEKYRDLVIRIAGYCAYFVDLSRWRFTSASPAAFPLDRALPVSTIFVSVAIVVLLAWVGRHFAGQFRGGGQAVGKTRPCFQSSPCCSAGILHGPGDDLSLLVWTESLKMNRLLSSH
jgi:pyruvate-formate lyase